MNSADNIHAFSKAKKKKLISVEKACMGDTPLTGKPTVKKPKKEVLTRRPFHVTPAKSTVAVSMWTIIQNADRTAQLVYLSDPFLRPMDYFSDKEAAHRKVKRLNDGLRKLHGKGLLVAANSFQAVRVSVLVNVDA